MYGCMGVPHHGRVDSVQDLEDSGLRAEGVAEQPHDQGIEGGARINGQMLMGTQEQ